MNKGIIYAVIGTVLIGGGIGAYLYFRKKKNTNELKDSDATNVVDEQTTDNDDKNVADNKVKDDKSDKKDKSNKKDKPRKKTSEKDNDIKTIIKYQKSVNVVPNESALKGKDEEFLGKWADAINKKTKRGGFLFNNRIYTLKKGEKSIANPIGKSVYSTPFVSKSKLSLNSPSYIDTNGGAIGKITDWKFDSKGNLYVYVKTLLSFGGRWWLANTISTSWLGNKKLSFTGGEEEIWAGFDNNFDVSFV
jgi:hypothetical protein